MLLWILSGTAADFFTNGDVTEISQAVSKEIRGCLHAHTYPYICMLVYRILGKTFPRENAAVQALFWSVMEKNPVSHTAHSKVTCIFMPTTPIKVWNLPSHFTAGVFFWHLLPVPVKMEHFLSLARQWFAVGVNLCQKKKKEKKEKQILEKMRCNSSCLRKGSTMHSVMAAWKLWQLHRALQPHFMHSW